MQPPRAVSQSLPPSLSNTDVSPVHFPSLSTLQGPRITYYSLEAHPVGTNPTDGCTSAEATPPFLDVAQLKVGSQSYFRRSYLPSYYSTHFSPLHHANKRWGSTSNSLFIPAHRQFLFVLPLQGYSSNRSKLAKCRLQFS